MLGDGIVGTSRAISARAVGDATVGSSKVDTKTLVGELGAFPPTLLLVDGDAYC